MIHVRLASLDDVLNIVKVYCSSISKWVRRIGEKEREVRYEDLTVDERWSPEVPG